MNNLQEEDHPCVGHGVRQSQDPAPHDGVAQVEDGHAERGLALKLKPSHWQFFLRHCFSTTVPWHTSVP